jgi:hypothetical protein
MYPKLRMDTALYGVQNKWLYHILHELSYGSDFICVELFFHGFLILAFIRLLVKMRSYHGCFYCTATFGKPLGNISVLISVE